MKDFSTFKPSIFISIPKRWVQLYNLIQEKVDIDLANSEFLEKEILSITGGKLKWGLSAAGYLDPDVFKFFENYKINMLSGYGMTEATGGITMTPVNQYVKNSVGKALPGIQLKIEKDGELCVGVIMFQRDTTRKKIQKASKIIGFIQETFSLKKINTTLL